VTCGRRKEDPLPPRALRATKYSQKWTGHGKNCAKGARKLRSKDEAQPCRQEVGRSATALGKNRSKYNARTHGIFSKVVVLDGESRSEFDAQLAGLREHFRPVGAFRDGLVEILAVTRWRQRRLLVAALESLDQELEKLRNYKTERVSVLQKRMELESLRRSVPDSPRLDQLLRYSTNRERTIDHTLSLLERAQRMRLGQPVTPSINVNVSS